MPLQEIFLNYQIDDMMKQEYEADETIKKIKLFLFFSSITSHFHVHISRGKIKRILLEF